MAEGLSHRLNFPSDHYFHFGKYPLEWWYFWGRLENGEFFHYAEFLASLGRTSVQTIHYSLNGEFHDEVTDWSGDIISTSGYAFGKFTFTTPLLSGIFDTLYAPPVIHKTITERSYYSIPDLRGYIRIKEEKIPTLAWFDHEINNYSDWNKRITWDWVGIKLNNGVNIMAYESNLERIADVTFRDNTLTTNFILEGKHLYLYDFGMYLILEPISDENIFEPRLGIKYSEQPFNVMAKGGIIGYGMRERTYRRTEEENAIQA